MQLATRQQNIEAFEILREQLIRKARNNFYLFCKLLEPEQYSEDKEYLKRMCDVLDKFIKGELKRDDGHIYRKIIINMPPRFYKTRTFIFLCQYALGLSKKNRVITTSYNDTVSNSFSRYTRDGMKAKKNFAYEIVYSDIFPKSVIKKTDSSIERWALEGEHLNYMGSGKGGTLTGFGCNIGAVDDLIKNAYEAMNYEMNEKNFDWFRNTFLSRLEENFFLVIINSRWSVDDLTGRLLKSADAADYYLFSLPAMNDKGEMLCESVLSRERFEWLRRNMDPQIFQANFMQDPFNAEGALYNEFKTYTTVPADASFKMGYIDTADKGDNYLAAVFGNCKKTESWITDCVYSRAGMEVTEEIVAEKIHKIKPNIVYVESNAGGASFARNIRRLLKEKYNWKDYDTEEIIREFHQKNNKESRILSVAYYMNKDTFFPADWHLNWREFHDAIMGYQRTGKNKVDDAPDALTGFYEKLVELQGSVTEHWRG